MRSVRAPFPSSSNNNPTGNRSFRLSFVVFLAFIFLLVGSPTFAQRPDRKLLSGSGEEKDRDQEQKRAQWNMRGREVPKGQSAAALRLRAHQQKMAMRAQRAAALRAAGKLGNSPQTLSWVNLGPAPLASDATGNGGQDYNWVSGRATSVLIDPSDATGNTVFLGGAYGGLWKSTNAGSQTSGNPGAVVWQSLIDDQPSLAVGAIALQPGNSSVILVGTGETNSSGDSYYGEGIFRSTDGGTTWSQITQDATHAYSFVGVGFSKIAFSTSNTNLVVASTAGDIGFDFGLEQDGNSTARGLYYSTDAGATWNRVALNDNSVPASVTGVVYNAAANTFYAAIRRHGIYASTDGQHFTRLSNQPTTGLASANCPAGSNSTNCQIYRGEFAVTPGRNEMYLWVVDAQSSEVDDGIWKTTNGGNGWSQILDNGITNCGSGGGGEGPGGPGCGVQQGAYNLELAAIPNAADTDLYAGTINLYKCHVASGASACSTIDPNVPNDWINLTHVYGCSILGELAHVHPDQHGLGFMVVSGAAFGYFAHDGGISRTLNGYTGLNSGTCTTPNQFDSLAQTLGSMTEFVSFSVHPTSADILLGGTQDNGSPKTSTGTISTIWQNALGGDGGYNAINPNAQPVANGGDGIAGDEWFVSNPDSLIGVCEDGTACNDQDTFVEAQPGYPSNGNIDQGPFYTPYILDPQSTSEMLIGTCRVWRGNTVSSVFSQLSVNFDTLNSSLCTGGEVNQVAGLAAGGPKDGNGFSNVVYATTWGYGPFAGVNGGEVWATTNAVGGAMSNVTGSINPSHYAISSVAIDTSVASGQTAYVGIMGFHVSHVWKTTNAGAGWTDWTGNLPDAPVVSLLVDPASGLIYAGTDVGVFSSPTTGTGGVWTEVGPVAGSGSGFLPSAPVTAIRIFSNGATKDLRVSTYGRGIWDYSLAQQPDFSLAVTATPSSTTINTNVVWNGTLTSIAGYSNAVTLSCTAGAPSTCTINPNPVTPTAGGAAFTVTVGNATPGTFSFSIQGTDGTITHSQAVTLTVERDFTLGAVTAPPAANPGQTTTTSVVITTVDGGAFTDTLGFACNGLPTGATCSFSPAVGAGATSPQTVQITVNTAGPFSGAAPRMHPARRAQNQRPRLWLPLSLPLAGIMLVGLVGRRIPRRYQIVGLCLTFALAGLLVACGGGNSGPAPVTVSPATAQVPLGGTQQFTASSTVTWTLTGTGAVGTISSSGLYTAPSTGTTPASFTVTATPTTGSAGTASITIPAVGVSVSPSPVNTLWPNLGLTGEPAQTQQFSQTVTDATNTSVTWTISSGGTTDTISSTGLYTAPTAVPAGPVTLTATSVADTTKTGNATVNIQTPTPAGTYPITVTVTEGVITHTTNQFNLVVN